MENFPFYFFSYKDTELNKIVHHQKKMTKGWKFVCSSSSSYSSSTPDGTSQHQRDFQSGSSLSYQRRCRHGDHILCSRPWKSLFRLQTRKKKDRNKLFAFLLHLRFDRRKAAWGFIVWCIAGGGGADPDASQGLTSFLKKTNSTVCAPALHSVHSHRLCAEIFMGFQFPPLSWKQVDSEICALCVGLKKKVSIIFVKLAVWRYWTSWQHKYVDCNTETTVQIYRIQKACFQFHLELLKNQNIAIRD